jgi:Porin subfamily
MTSNKPLTLAALLTTLAVIPSAYAADLKSKSPVSYVKVCSAQGEGFFEIPGSDTCLRIGGRVRAETRYFEPLWTTPGNGRSVPSFGYRTRAQLAVDARTSTSYGLLRTFIRYELNRESGPYTGGGAQTITVLEKAFIQFGGLTAGRVTSFFDFYANDLNFSEIGGSDLGQVNALAYTRDLEWLLGKGFTLTMSREDRLEREISSGSFTYAGQRMPDGVSVLRYDNEDGVLTAAQASLAVRQMRVMDRKLNGEHIDSDYGFAGQLGAKFALPFAKGDALWLQAAYADGAISFLGLNNIPNSLGAAQTVQSDAAALNGSLKRTKGYALTAALLHYWTPSIRQGLFGSYTRLDYKDQAFAAYGLIDTTVLQGGTNLIWSPVKDLDIGAELMYHRLDPKGRPNFGNGTVNYADALEARFRIQRDF